MTAPIHIQSTCYPACYCSLLRVCTDVASSTQLWEWNPRIMDSAIDIHNTAIRDLLEDCGGHEIRNVGGALQ